jgi:hypothetical protein
VTDEPPAELEAQSLAAAIRRLLREAHRVAPDRLAVLAAAVAARCGVTNLWLWLADHEQRSLVRVSRGDVTEDLEFGEGRIDLETSLGGRAYVSSKPVEVARDEDVMMWLPLLDGVDRIGVLQVQVADVDATGRDRLASLASAIAAEVTTRGAYGDVFVRARRRQGMGVAAEVIFQLLPPPTFTTRDITIAGALEPAYQVGGDVFDFALNTPILHVAIFDAVGHGLASSLVATLAINGYRNARRAGAALIDTYESVDGLIAERFTDNTFATGHLAELDTATGTLHWVNAGHPPPLLVRDAPWSHPSGRRSVSGVWQVTDGHWSLPSNCNPATRCSSTPTESSRPGHLRVSTSGWSGWSSSSNGPRPRACHPPKSCADSPTPWSTTTEACSVTMLRPCWWAGSPCLNDQARSVRRGCCAAPVDTFDVV